MNELISALGMTGKNAGSALDDKEAFDGDFLKYDTENPRYPLETNDSALDDLVEDFRSSRHESLRERLAHVLEQLFPKDEHSLEALTKDDNMQYGIPREHGGWKGEPGDSSWYPDRDYVPIGGRDSNPEGKTWGEILDENGIECIEFHDGEPDFSKISKGTVEIEDYTNSRESNYAKADQKLADQWNQEGKDGRTDWTAKKVETYRTDNHLTWHERSDMKTMDLVPTEVHANVPHSGGISEVNKQKSESSS